MEEWCALSFRNADSEYSLVYNGRPRFGEPFPLTLQHVVGIFVTKLRTLFPPLIIGTVVVTAIVAIALNMILPKEKTQEK